LFFHLTVLLVRRNLDSKECLIVQHRNRKHYNYQYSCHQNCIRNSVWCSYWCAFTPFCFSQHSLSFFPPHFQVLFFLQTHHQIHFIFCFS
jgi:hypothetical protein